MLLYIFCYNLSTKLLHRNGRKTFTLNIHIVTVKDLKDGDNNDYGP